MSATPHPVTLTVGAAESPATTVVIGRGLVDQDPLLAPNPQRRVVGVITQPGPASALARRLAERLTATGLTVGVLELADRDAAKTLAEVDRAYGFLHELGTGRADTVLAVGGGAITDVGGFVAATYLRGIEAAYVSTTLLGAVDASVGGKTGINHGGKNLVGAFWHPRRVVIDLDVLDALPEPVRREGFAEAVKTGFIGDPHIVDLCERHGLQAPLDEIVPRSLAVKTAVVNADAREHDVRAVLNYGHTIGHAVEIAAGLSHGDAVGIGMVAAGAVSERLRGFSERVRHDAVIERLGLPAQASGVAAEELHMLVGRDKKRDAGGLRMVLLDTIGKAVVQRVDARDVEDGLKAIGVAV